jgi:hypothetical protein
VPPLTATGAAVRTACGQVPERDQLPLLGAHLGIDGQPFLLQEEDRHPTFRPCAGARRDSDEADDYGEDGGASEHSGLLPK